MIQLSINCIQSVTGVGNVEEEVFEVFNQTLRLGLMSAGTVLMSAYTWSRIRLKTTVSCEFGCGDFFSLVSKGCCRGFLLLVFWVFARAFKISNIIVLV